MDRIPNGENGLDPPGVPTSIIISYQEILTDISNEALRMRSDGFHARPGGTHAQKVGRTNPETWNASPAAPKSEATSPELRAASGRSEHSLQTNATLAVQACVRATPSLRQEPSAKTFAAHKLASIRVRRRGRGIRTLAARGTGLGRGDGSRSLPCGRSLLRQAGADRRGHPPCTAPHGAGPGGHILREDAQLPPG